MPKVCILPILPAGEDPGDGGIRRVLVGQHATLPLYGWELTDDPREADVLACHVEIPAPWLKLFGSKPIIVHNHGLYWSDGGYEWGNWEHITNAHCLDAIRAADMVTAVSNWTAQSIRRNTMRDVRVVYHGVDLVEWQPLGPDEAEAEKPYVLWNKTRVDPICTTQPLDAAVRRLPNVQFVSTFGSPANNLHVTGKVPFEEAKQLVRHASVYLATTRETFGIGTLEALAAGVPVVGYDFGGQSEIITHRVDGWLAQPGDEDGLAEGIQWALSHFAEISPRAREKAEQFPVERSGQAYAELYSEVLLRFMQRAQNPRTTIVVPAYQMGDYLADTLESIAHQTDRDWECLIVNDASPDPRDHEIAERYQQADSRFRELRLSQNGYLAHARNVGIFHARGRYILPVDADDQITFGTVEALADALDADRSLHIAYGGALFVEADGRTRVVYRGFENDPGHSGWPQAFQLDRQMLGPGQVQPYCSMFRREVWQLTGGYRERSRSSEDQDFWLRAASYGFRAEKVTEGDTLIYRVRPGSMSSPDGEGWEDHRPWFPWTNPELAQMVPAGVVDPRRTAEITPMPSLDPVAIAVIIPVGPDHARYVVDAVDSVDAQRFRYWECIVINDSGDELNMLPSWVRVIEKRRIVGQEVEGVEIVYDEFVMERAGNVAPLAGTEPIKFGGVAAARNAGIRASRAPLYLPLDADDYLQPRCLEFMLRNYQQGTEPAIIYSDFWEDPQAVGKFQIWETPDYDPRSYIRKGLGRAVTALTPKSVWEQVGGYREGVPWEDWAFAIDCAVLGVCERRIALPLFTYRKHTGTRRGANMGDFEESKRVIMALDFHMQPGEEPMACQRCGGGRATTQMSFVRAGSQADREGSTLLRYLGNGSSQMNFRSKVQPGVSYRCGTEQREVYVLDADVAGFLKSGMFERAPMVVQDSQDAIGAEPVLLAARTPAASADPQAAGAGTLSAWTPFDRDSAVAVAPPPVRTQQLQQAQDVDEHAAASRAADATPEQLEEQARLRAAAQTPPPASTDEDEANAAERVSEPARALANRMGREALNQTARDEGIGNPEQFRTKPELAAAILVMRETKRMMAG